MNHAPQRFENPGHWDSVVMGSILFCLAFLAFAPSILNPVHRLSPISLAVGIHGILFTGWVLLFVAQATLIATGKKTLHRNLGFAAIGLATLMLVSGYQATITMTKRGYDLSGDLHLTDALMSAVFPLGDLFSFALLFTLGLIYRRQATIHKRLMLLTTIGMMMPATVAHFVGHNLPDMPVLVPLLLALLFLAPAAYDRIRFGRFHPITLWGGILLIVWGNLRAALIGPSASWKQFVTQLIG